MSTNRPITAVQKVAPTSAAAHTPPDGARPRAPLISQYSWRYREPMKSDAPKPSAKLGAINGPAGRAIKRYATTPEARPNARHLTLCTLAIGLQLNELCLTLFEGRRSIDYCAEVVFISVLDSAKTHTVTSDKPGRRAIVLAKAAIFLTAHRLDNDCHLSSAMSRHRPQGSQRDKWSRVNG